MARPRVIRTAWTRLIWPSRASQQEPTRASAIQDGALMDRTARLVVLADPATVQGGRAFVACTPITPQEDSIQA